MTEKLPIKTSLPLCLKEQVSAKHLCQQQTERSVSGQSTAFLFSNSIIKILISSSLNTFYMPC